jgi:hypothetical protein
VVRGSRMRGYTVRVGGRRVRHIRHRDLRRSRRVIGFSPRLIVVAAIIGLPVLVLTRNSVAITVALAIGIVLLLALAFSRRR